MAASVAGSVRVKPDFGAAGAHGAGSVAGNAGSPQSEQSERATRRGRAGAIRCSLRTGKRSGSNPVTVPPAVRKRFRIPGRTDRRHEVAVRRPGSRVPARVGASGPGESRGQVLVKAGTAEAGATSVALLGGRRKTKAAQLHSRARSRFGGTMRHEDAAADRQVGERKSHLRWEFAWLAQTPTSFLWHALHVVRRAPSAPHRAKTRRAGGPRPSRRQATTTRVLSFHAIIAPWATKSTDFRVLLRQSPNLRMTCPRALATLLVPTDGHHRSHSRPGHASRHRS